MRLLINILYVNLRIFITKFFVCFIICSWLNLKLILFTKLYIIIKIKDEWLIISYSFGLYLITQLIWKSRIIIRHQLICKLITKRIVGCKIGKINLNLCLMIISEYKVWIEIVHLNSCKLFVALAWLLIMRIIYECIRWESFIM